MEITRLSEGEKTLKFDMEDIDWKALDFFLEEVENGYYSKLIVHVMTADVIIWS